MHGQPAAGQQPRNRYVPRRSRATVVPPFRLCGPDLRGSVRLRRLAPPVRMRFRHAVAGSAGPFLIPLVAHFVYTECNTTKGTFSGPERYIHIARLVFLSRHDWKRRERVPRGVPLSCSGIALERLRPLPQRHLATPAVPCNKPELDGGTALLNAWIVPLNGVRIGHQCKMR